MSNTIGTTSSHESGSIVSSMSNIFNISNDYFHIVEVIVRKLGHISEYTFLAISLFYGIDKTYKKDYLIPFIISILYACTDEFHQLFVPGRSGMIQDVFIDSIGIIIGLGICFIIMKFKDRKKDH